MFKAISITAGVIALALALTGCVGGAQTQTLESAQKIVEDAKISCESATDQALSEVIPQNNGEDVQGSLLLCQDENAMFGMPIFDNPQDIGDYLASICESATDEATITQLKGIDVLWGPNWFVDASANPELLSKLQDAFGGEIANLYSKCPA